MISAAVFGPSWNMLLAMFAGMALGMALSMPFALVAGALFGAMEVMLPVMTTGMVAGMIVSMAAAMGDIGFAWAARAGAYSGIVVVVATYFANAWIKRKASQWTS
ncbi:MAG: hypothetical protein JRG80_10615 [Deltaproteobacteria bacterium]|nr:hypothetical protein [Deltaproteobacteria bacterium]